MPGPLFFTHATIEQWIDDGEVLFEDDTLTIFEQNASYQLVPAVRVTTILSGDDVMGWMGQVLTVAGATAKGAEHVQGSLIIGDTAYACEEGFWGDAKSAAAATPAALPNPSAATPTSAEISFDESEAMLADFLLKHLR